MNDTLIQEILNRIKNIELGFERSKVIESVSSPVGGTGTAGRIAEWATASTLQASTLVKSGVGVLTLSAAGAYTLTVPGTGTAALMSFANTGTFQVADGSESSPTLTFSADQNTGWFRFNADEIGMALGGYTTATLAGSATKFRRDGAGQYDAYQLVWLRRRAAGAAISNADVIGDFAFNAQLGAGETQIALLRVSAPDASASYSTQIDFFTSKAGTLGTSLTIDANRNLLVGGLAAMGASVVSGIGVVSGTAPSSSPADMAQVWVADANATAGKAWPHMRPEDGTNRVIMGVAGTSGVSSGTGTVKMNGATNRDNVGWITTHDNSGNTIYIPYWTTITG